MADTEQYNKLKKKRSSVKRKFTTFSNFVDSIMEKFPHYQITEPFNLRQLKAWLTNAVSLLSDYNIIQNEMDELSVAEVNDRENFEQDCYAEIINNRKSKARM